MLNKKSRDLKNKQESNLDKPKKMTQQYLITYIKM